MNPKEFANKMKELSENTTNFHSVDIEVNHSDCEEFERRD